MKTINELRKTSPDFNHYWNIKQATKRRVRFRKMLHHLGVSKYPDTIGLTIEQLHLIASTQNV